MKYLRKVASKTRRDRVRNTTIRMRLGVRPLEEMIKDNQLRWYGHLNRMDESRYPKRVFEARLVGTQPRGRRRTTWKDNLQSNCILGEIVIKFIRISRRRLTAIETIELLEATDDDESEDNNLDFSLSESECIPSDDQAGNGSSA
ncbi:hypothetical protein ILUMI_07498 [Ignelater luminosus]|uniref:Uncharacterized protein n=1 Tax=Ignelater luminosus TaxID=2038154 RepID=A0A8K0GEC6_IGNLU|nr:hypothetical protein ILUMI_07498 [Ignelater luminosus]